VDNLRYLPRLVNIHDRIGERIEDGDRLVYLDNYYGCGDAVRATIDELADFRRRAVARRRDFLALAAPFAGFRRVVAGVDRQRRGLVECEFATVVDGGAATGGPLVTAALPGTAGSSTGSRAGAPRFGSPPRSDCRGGEGLRQRLAI
jgi:hypothetical protein